MNRSLYNVKADLEYYIVLWCLAFEEWLDLIKVKKSDPLFTKYYNYFWNGALDLDINIYNRFVD